MSAKAFIWDGCVLCYACSPMGECEQVIFAWDEFDYPLHCEECHEFIPVGITRDGVRWIHERVAAGWNDPALYKEYDDHFHFNRDVRFCLWTFLGRYDALGNFEDY